MSSLLRIVIVTTLLLAINGANTANSQPGTPGLYIALGDSIAAGIGSSLPRKRGSPALVSQWMDRQAGVALPHENLAVPGETAASFLAGGQLQRFQESVARAHDAGLPITAVTVSLGGNELLGLASQGLTDRQAGLDDFRVRYAEAMSAIRAEIGPDAPLIATTTYDLSQGNPSIRFSDAWWVEQFNEVIRSAAAEHGARIADLAPLFHDAINVYTHHPYDVHPTNAGHEAIARAVWSQLALDRTPPRFTVLSSDVATRATPTVRFTVEDEVGVSTVHVVDGDVAYHGPFAVSEREYVVLLDLTAVEADEVEVTIESGDDAGNMARQTVTITVARTGKGD